MVGADFRIGLDETNRTLVICDAGDIATDFNLTAKSSPSLAIFSASGTTYTMINSNSITSTTGSNFVITSSSESSFAVGRPILTPEIS